MVAAVSSSKCNSLFERFSIEHSVPNLIGSSPIEGFAGPVIELPGDPFQFSLCDFAHIHPLGQILAQQAVDVLAASALPGTVWIAELDLNTEVFG